MDDQKKQLEQLGITSCCYNSTVSDKKKLRKEIYENQYNIIYITPESVVLNGDFLESIEEETGISLFAIDEAHCISSHGHDFRTAYRNLNVLRESCPEVPIMCVTATATPEVIKDINDVMGMNGITVVASFDRPNLIFHAEQRTAKAEIVIAGKIKKNKGSSIVYCLTRGDTDKMADKLKSLGVKCLAYHAGLETKKRQGIQERFMDDTVRCIVATVAFGMGINKPDVTLVIHYGCPNSIESYYQECGRAGRNGARSCCYLYYTPRDFIIQKRFISDIKDEKYKNARSKLLGTMITFANTSTCRRKVILEYFGETGITDNCKKCDNCRRSKEKPKLTKNEEIKFYKLLSTVKYVDCNLGSTKIINIIKGSKSKDIPKKYTGCTWYAIGSRETITTWKAAMTKATNLNFIESYAVSKLIYVPRITDAGKEWLDDFKKKNAEVVKTIKYI